MSIGTFRCDMVAMCKAVDVLHMSLSTTLDLSYCHTTTTILRSMVVVHRDHR